MNLSQHHVPGSKNTYYIPDFVTADEEAYLLRKIQETPQPKWKQLSNRRLQTWGGDLTAKNVLVAQPLPHFIYNYPDLISRIASTGAFDNSPHQRPNHVILNEYHPGQGIMPHQDGPAYHPVVATLSLGGHMIMHYYDLPVNMTPVLSLLLEPRSLVVTTCDQYTTHGHGIDAVIEDCVRISELANVGMLGSGGSWGAVPHTGDSSSSSNSDVVLLRRQTRYSLTCRDVARVLNVGIGTSKVV